MLWCRLLPDCSQSSPGMPQNSEKIAAYISLGLILWQSLGSSRLIMRPGRQVLQPCRCPCCCQQQSNTFRVTQSGVRSSAAPLNTDSAQLDASVAGSLSQGPHHAQWQQFT